MKRERIVIGGPNSADYSALGLRDRGAGSAIVFFSEPYEVNGGRAEEVYRELLPPLVTLAASSGRRLVVKLHPFESVRDRRRLVEQILLVGQQGIAHIRGGPMTQQLLEEAWFGITVESTSVIECAMKGVPCFIATWMVNSPYGYVQQYSAFGMGEPLLSVEQLTAIPSLLLGKSASTPAGGLWQLMDPGNFRKLLAGEHPRMLAKSLRTQMCDHE